MSACGMQHERLGQEDVESGLLTREHGDADYRMCMCM